MSRLLRVASRSLRNSPTVYTAVPDPDLVESGASFRRSRALIPTAIERVAKNYDVTLMLEVLAFWLATALMLCKAAISCL